MSDDKTEEYPVVKFTQPPKPVEPLPEGWDWWWSGNEYGDPGSWLPCHEWSAMNTQNAGEAWLMEANGRMGPHGDSSKVNLAPKADPLTGLTDEAINRVYQALGMDRTDADPHGLDIWSDVEELRNREGRLEREVSDLQGRIDDAVEALSTYPGPSTTDTTKLTREDILLAQLKRIRTNLQRDTPKETL